MSIRKDPNWLGWLLFVDKVERGIPEETLPN